MIRLPFDAARAAVDLSRNMNRSVREANELMEVSREQLELMRRQADQALEQAERMNELLGRVVKLTEPLSSGINTVIPIASQARSSEKIRGRRYGRRKPNRRLKVRMRSLYKVK